jgi:hypothetical protein
MIILTGISSPGEKLSAAQGRTRHGVGYKATNFPVINYSLSLKVYSMSSHHSSQPHIL